jgi:hypothetical protein
VLVLVAGIRTADSIDLPFPSPERSPPAYYDVSGTGQLTPFDALLVVSHLLHHDDDCRWGCRPSRAKRVSVATGQADIVCDFRIG